MKTFFLTLLALLAFAGNSILCRLALASGSIDAGSFTVLRLVSGILALLLLMGINGARATEKKTIARGSWLGGIALFAYATFFSYAYINLSTATGALILFGTVQIALILFGIYKGQRPGIVECFGFVIACLGLLYLLWPELSKPTVVGLVFMFLAGIAWAVYTVQGQGSTDPLADTTYNFLKTAPMLLVLSALMLSGLIGSIQISVTGALLALASGAITSGVGYAFWYAALKDISHTTAAVSQLSVPIFAAIFGIVFAAEALDQRIVISTLMVLGGILMVILFKKK